MPTPWVADCSAAHPSVAQFRAAGAVGVIRYMDPGRNDGTEITAAEIADYHANNFPYGLVMEYGADWLEGGYPVGHAKALQALADEAALGIPKGVTYGACDFDIQPSQYGPALDCLHGMADAYGGWQYVGVYGSKSFCEWVGGAGSPIKHFWSTDAWSNYTPAANAVLHQHAQWPAGVPVVDGCDHNLILGDWGPRNGSTDWFDMASKDDLLAVVRQALNEGTGAGQKDWPSTSKAVLAGMQGLTNKVNTLVGASNIIISGGNGNPGLKQLADILNRIAADPVSIDEAGVQAAVKAAFTGLKFEVSA
jgi:hypothetical protein